MPAKWSFNESNPSDIASEVTQVEQFDNDRMRLESSLVREVIQNSMDASDKSGPVRVTFAIKDLTEMGPLKVRKLRESLKPVEPHFEASDVALPDEENVRLLCIEDFNTSGLTGSFEKKDGKNFSNFWRVMGKSEKSRGKGGRRGLGKLVFAASSKVNTFFGVTKRSGDESLFAMGHVILKNHMIGEIEYRPHGVWHYGRTNDSKMLQLPTSDPNDLYMLQFISSFERRTEPGFTILIPYLKDRITHQNIIDNVLRNYYFSILSNQLTVSVNGVDIDSESFAKVYKNSRNVRRSVPLEFISSVRKSLNERKHTVKSNPIDSKTLNMKTIPEALYSKKQISEMRNKYNNNDIVHVVIPLKLYDRVTHTGFAGEFNLFLQSLNPGDTVFKFFARGPIMLPGELSNFKGNCHAGLVAEKDDPVAAFLGDAENPAHTEWNLSAPLLEQRWDPIKDPLKVIRKSLQDLFDLIAKPEESTENDLLSEFFSLPRGHSDTKTEGRGVEVGNGVPPSSPPPVYPVKDLGFEINKMNNGFILRPDHESKCERTPKTIRVEMAYNRIGGNALGHYDKLDFDLFNSSTIEVESVQSEIEKVESNVLNLNITGSDYLLNVMLTDLNRDLFIRASVTEWKT